jgi:DNA-binding response OmpR family regulator
MKVLVLDNDRSMRELVAHALRLQEVECVAVGTVEEAEAVLAGATAVLMDFHLGGGHSGAAVVRRWAAEGRMPPFWLVTGTPEDEEVRSLVDLPQLRAVVGKPFSLLSFAREVKISLSAPLPEPPPEPDLGPWPDTLD